MSPAVKLTGFTAVLAVLFGGAALAGGAIDPDRDSARATHGADGAAPHGKSSSGAHGAKKPDNLLRGLAVAQSGLRIVVEDPELRRGRTEHVRFRIVDERNRTVRDFDVEHTKRMHLITARRDLTGFQHLHPTRARDGSWSVALRLTGAGSYRLFADFTSKGEAFTLASDLRVDGSADLLALPAPAAATVSDGGYDVRMAARGARPGAEADLRFTITKDGQPVHTESYLGAGGHLVALRESDMAFLHVHPTADGHGDERTSAHRDVVGFASTFPTEGRYRLFLQFKHDGRVQTVAFTQEVR